MMNKLRSHLTAAPAPFDVRTIPTVPNADTIEDEIAAVIPRRVAQPPLQALAYDAPPANQLPDYVEHQPDVGRVGRLTAEALVVEHESAAKAVEELGKELGSLLARLDAEAANIAVAVDEVKALAAHFREEGRLAFTRVEETALRIQRIRDICADLSPKK